MCCYYNAAFKKNASPLWKFVRIDDTIETKRLPKRRKARDLPRKRLRRRLQIGHDNPWNAKLGHDLTAGTAGRARPFRISYDSQGFKAPLPFGKGLKNGRPFGAVTQGVAGVLDVAAAKNPARLHQDGSADGKMRVRAVRMAAIVDSQFDKVGITHKWRAPFK